MSDVTIRQFTEDDLERLSTLLRETPEVMCNGDDVSAESLRAQTCLSSHIHRSGLACLFAADLAIS